MSRATVTTFGRGVSFVASGETGTQANEFEAAIKSVTSATTVGAVFLYDTRSDSDGGAWRKKCAGLSWFDETLNTATRGGRREFPSVALIVADNGDPDGTARTITIYDLDDVAAPAWMVFEASSNGSKYLWNDANGDVTGIAALNGQVYISNTGGGWDKLIKFADDEMVNLTGPSNPASRLSGPIANRNATGYTDWTALPAYWINQIVSSTANDCAMTVLEGAEIGALGLPIPTVAVATDGGVSVIHPNGDVYDQTYTVYSDNQADHVTWDDKGGLSWASRNKSIYHLYLRNPLFADSSAAPDNIFYTTNNITAGKAVHPLGGGGTPITARTNIGGRDFATGAANGLSIIKHNDGNPDEGMVSYHTSDYCTGYQLGDIRGAFLMGDRTADRSVKGNTLTLNQASGSDTVDAEKVDGASGTADLYGYKSFSADNYLSRASDTDFDFGTGDFSIMFWVKSSTSGTYEDYIARGDATAEAGDWLIERHTNNKLRWYRNSGSTWANIAETSSTIGSTWVQVIATRRGGKFYWYINGKLETSATDANSYTPSGGSALTIGRRLNWDYHAAGASISLVRISATAPTPTQVADIYRAEAPLFRSGAKCLLSGTSAIEDLSYDSSTDLLTTAGNQNNIFRGLERVDTFNGQTHSDWNSTSSHFVASTGGVSSYVRAYGTGGVLVDLPAIDVRGDINTADTKLPDDGKLHFSGVTASTATPTVIGHIPLALGDKITVKARVQGHIYQYGSLNGYYEEVTATFQRPYDTGTVAVHTSFSNPTHSLSDTTLAGLDVELNANDTAKTCEVKVTGSASYRMQWNAEVEVQRITEKQYER